MEHIRFGRLPASRQWVNVVKYLATEEDNSSVEELSNSILNACNLSFSKIGNDILFHKVIYLLFQMIGVSGGDSLSEELEGMGIYIPSNPIRIDIILGFERAIAGIFHDEVRNTTELSELAKKSAITTLNNALQKPPPLYQTDLWQDIKEKSTVHRQLEATTTPDGFCNLVQDFFVDLAKSNIKYFIDLELTYYLGQEGFLESVPDMSLFDKAIERHCREVSFIIRRFTKYWNTKILSNRNKELTVKNVRNFCCISLEKIRSEVNCRNKIDEKDC